MCIYRDDKRKIKGIFGEARLFDKLTNRFREQFGIRDNYLIYSDTVSKHRVRSYILHPFYPI